MRSWHIAVLAGTALLLMVLNLYGIYEMFKLYTRYQMEADSRGEKIFVQAPTGQPKRGSSRHWSTTSQKSPSPSSLSTTSPPLSEDDVTSTLTTPRYRLKYQFDRTTGVWTKKLVPMDRQTTHRPVTRRPVHRRPPPAESSSTNWYFVYGDEHRRRTTTTNTPTTEDTTTMSAPHWTTHPRPQHHHQHHQHHRTHPDTRRTEHDRRYSTDGGRPSEPRHSTDHQRNRSDSRHPNDERRPVHQPHPTRDPAENRHLFSGRHPSTLTPHDQQRHLPGIHHQHRTDLQHHQSHGRHPSDVRNPTVHSHHQHPEHRRDHNDTADHRRPGAYRPRLEIAIPADARDPASAHHHRTGHNRPENPADVRPSLERHGSIHVQRPVDSRHPTHNQHVVDTRYPTDNRNPIDIRQPIDTRYPIDIRYPTDTRYPIDIRHTTHPDRTHHVVGRPDTKSDPSSTVPSTSIHVTRPASVAYRTPNNYHPPTAATPERITTHRADLAHQHQQHHNQHHHHQHVHLHHHHHSTTTTAVHLPPTTRPPITTTTVPQTEQPVPPRPVIVQWVSAVTSGAPPPPQQTITTIVTRPHRPASDSPPPPPRQLPPRREEEEESTTAEYAEDDDGVHVDVLTGEGEEEEREQREEEDKQREREEKEQREREETERREEEERERREKEEKEHHEREDEEHGEMEGGDSQEMTFFSSAPTSPPPATAAPRQVIVTLPSTQQHTTSQTTSAIAPITVTREQQPVPPTTEPQIRVEEDGKSEWIGPTQPPEPEDGGMTLVTALMDIGRGEWFEYRRPLEKYHSFMENVLSLKVNMVIFTDASSVDFITAYRNKYGHANRTKIYNITLEALPLHRYLFPAQKIIEDELKNPDLWKAWDPQMQKHPEAKSPEYDILVNSKTYFLYNATLEDPFHSDWFVWLDAGYGHGDQTPFPIDHVWRPKFPRHKISVIKVTPEHDAVSGYTLERLYRQNWSVISGGFLAGDRHSIGQLFSLVHRKVIELINQDRVDDDQTVLVLLIKSHPHLFNVLHGEWFDAFKLFPSIR